jgi:hypothetical protein
MSRAVNKRAHLQFATAKRGIPASFKPLARDIYYLLHGLLYIGKNHLCPCCRWHLRKFLPCTQIFRPGEMCARCGSLSRHRILWLYIKDQIESSHGQLKVLHFAPEFCIERKLKHLANVEYHSADLHSQWAQEHFDITHIPESDNSYDIVLCSHVLEHVAEDRIAMKEIYRILKPGGWAVLQVPIQWNRPRTYEDPGIVTPDQRLEAFGQDDHVRIYGADFIDRLVGTGFETDLNGYTQKLGERELELYSVRYCEPIVVCCKPANAGSVAKPDLRNAMYG